MTLNKRQRWAVFTGLAAGFIMGIFPPYLAEFRSGSGRVSDQGAGYAFIFSDWPRYASVDVTRLGVQWVTVGIGTMGVVVLLGGKKEEPDTKPGDADRGND